MERRRQASAAQDPSFPCIAEYGNVQLWGDMRVVQRSQLLKKADVGRTALQEDVLAVVYLLACLRFWKGERPSSQEGPLLQQHYRVAAVSQVAGGCHPRQASAHHDYLPEILDATPVTHNLAISASFSLVLRLILLLNTS